MNESSKHPRTLLAHAGSEARSTGHVIGPIVTSANFARNDDYELMLGIDYARDVSPAYASFQTLLARLEGGHEAMVFASGLAAATAVFSSLRPGDHVVIPRAMYWGLRRWITRFADDWGLSLDAVDAWDESKIQAAMRPGHTRLLWLETPANPTWEVSDIQSASRIAHAVGAMVCVDSTAATPLITRPLELGADFVMHSATKYLNGHSDVVAGALVAREPSERWEKIHMHRRDAGPILGTFEAWLLTRGMRTLAVRVERSSASALELAQWLEKQPAVAGVLYPGLPSHPQHEVARRQMRGGFGGMLSILVKGGREAAIQIAKRLEVFTRATSLGGTESLVEHRHTAEGPGSIAPESLLRLSIGLEDVEDLRRDLAQAFEACAAP